MLKWTDRGFFNINFAAQIGSHDFTETSAPTVYGESASISTPHQIGSGFLFDISGGARVAGNLGIGVGYSRFSTSESPTVTAQIPNPLFFGKPRSATAATGTLDHSESVVHLQVLWMLPARAEAGRRVVRGPLVLQRLPGFDFRGPDGGHHRRGAPVHDRHARLGADGRAEGERDGLQRRRRHQLHDHAPDRDWRPSPLLSRVGGSAHGGRGRGGNGRSEGFSSERGRASASRSGGAGTRRRRSARRAG